MSVHAHLTTAACVYCIKSVMRKSHVTSACLHAGTALQHLLAICMSRCKLNHILHICIYRSAHADFVGYTFFCGNLLSALESSVALPVAEATTWRDKTLHLLSRQLFRGNWRDKSNWKVLPKRQMVLTDAAWYRQMHRDDPNFSPPVLTAKVRMLFLLMLARQHR